MFQVRTNYKLLCAICKDDSVNLHIDGGDIDDSNCKLNRLQIIQYNDLTKINRRYKTKHG